MTKYLSIDPGTSNLGWAFGTADSIDEAGVDNIWMQKATGGKRESIRHATIAWYRDHHRYFEDADKVLVELQYTSTKTLGVFPPMVVMDTILALVEFEFPGKGTHISARAVKQRFKITGDYASRKAQVVEFVGLGGLPGRMHDIADCILMMQYEEERKATPISSILAEKRARRAAIRDRSPVRNSSNRVK